MRGATARLRPALMAASIVTALVTMAAPATAAEHRDDHAASSSSAAGHASRSVVRLKLADGSGITVDQLQPGRPVAAAGPAPAGLAELNAALAAAGVRRVQRAFSTDTGTAGATEAHLEQRTGRELEDLSGWLRITVADDRAAALVSAVRPLDAVDTAFPEAAAVAPPSVDYRPLQAYAGTAPAGLGTLASAAVPGSGGGRVRIADIEYSWNTQHEDLPALRTPGALIANYTPVDPFGSTDHGTAVMGILGAAANGSGVTGLVPEAELHMVNAFTQETGYNLANAVDVARKQLRPGDVILIEQQAYGDDGRYLPSEFWRDVYDAIETATAAGVIVVEAAGNGGVDLDAPQYAAAFGGGRADSGAIIVGAGSAGTVSGACTAAGPRHSRLPFSSYGARVDLQGWGACVATTGYGDLAGRANTAYTAGFNGTSSAAPIVAAAAASLSSAYQARFGTAPTPAQVRGLLVRTGTAQDSTSAGAPAGHIGPLPNLGAAYFAAGITGAPQAPAGTATSAGPATATVTWTPPAGGQPVTGYRVTRTGRDAAGAATATLTLPATARTATFAKLLPGTAYTLSVRALNSAGEGAAAARTVSTARTAPFGPAGTAVHLSGATATVTWTPPASTGGSAVTGYRVTRQGRVATGPAAATVILPASARSARFAKLLPGTAYTFTVRAVNAQGVGVGVAKTLTVSRNAASAATRLRAVTR